jgi:hypothetical protein
MDYFYVRTVQFVGLDYELKISSGRFGEEIKMSLPVPGIEPGFLGCPTYLLAMETVACGIVNWGGGGGVQ